MTDEARLEHWMESQNDGASEDYRARTFRSREIVWSAFESMARELEIPIDDLVNDAMATYAGARGYPLTGQPPVRSDRAPIAGGSSGRSPSFEEDPDDLVSTSDRPTLGVRAIAGDHRAPDPRSAPGRGAMPRPPPRLPSRPPPPPRSASAVPLPPPPPPSRGSAFAEVRQSPPRLAPPAAPSRVPPPPPSRQHAPEPRERYHSSPASIRQLVLEYEGQAYPVEKERFLIGRSKAQSDLRLDDPNVSRQHAVIERVGAAWYIVDLGSTNGIRIAGERVARRALMDSDVITITTHEIRCFFRAD